MLTFIRPTQDGINTGNIKENISSMRRDKYLLFKAKSILKIDKLLERTKMIKTIRNGQFFTLMLQAIYHLQDTARTGECISTDLSSSKLQ